MTTTLAASGVLPPSTHATDLPPPHGPGAHHTMVAIGVSTRPYLLDLDAVLGEGNNSKVVLGTDTTTGTKVAIKIFNKVQLSERAKKLVEQEIRTLRRLPPHPNIIRLIDVIDQDELRYVVHEYIEEGDLFEFVLKHGPSLTERLVKPLFLQIVKAVHFLHINGVVHHDIKLENVGIRKLSLSAAAPTTAASSSPISPPSPPSPPTTTAASEEAEAATTATTTPSPPSAMYPISTPSVVLMDFGYSCEFSNDLLLSRFCGTLCYCAPELLLGKPYSATPVDVWAMGVVLFVLICKRFPFDTDNPDTLYKQASSRDYIRSILHTNTAQISEEAQDLLQKIFVPAPYKRISVPEILRHRFLKGTDE